MPNGGSDNCGTCWFNRTNEGQRSWAAPRREIPASPFCQIRGEPIEDPAYTYCANHPYRRSVRDPIPIGPMLAGEMTGGFAYERVLLKPSPDSEEIRQHLLDLLTNLEETAADDAYPALPRVVTIIIWQLGEFREQRAIEPLQRLADERLEGGADFVRSTLALISEGAPPAE